MAIISVLIMLAPDNGTTVTLLPLPTERKKKFFENKKIFFGRKNAMFVKNTQFSREEISVG